MVALETRATGLLQADTKQESRQGEIPQVFIEAMRPEILDEQEVNYGGPLSLLIQYFRGEHPEFRGAEMIDGLTGKETKVVRHVLARFYHSSDFNLRYPPSR